MTGEATEDATYDLITIGGGLGGLSAAVTAAHAGAKVLVLEKSEYVGGVAAYSGGAIWIPGNHLAAEAGKDDTREAAEQYLDYVGGRGLPYDHVMRKSYLDNGPQAIQAFMAAGVPFQLLEIQEQYYPDAEGSSTGLRHVESWVYGDELGEWLDRLRPSIYHEAIYGINDLFGARRANVSEEEFVGEAELADRKRRSYLARGRGMVGAFLKAAIGLGVRVETESAVTELVRDADGTVTGVVAVDAEGASRTWTAREGVLIATGSYGSAPWAASMEGLPELYEQAPPILHGDGLLLGESAGAAAVRAGYTFAVLGVKSSRTHPGTDIPVYLPTLETLPKPHIVVVNAEGHRFGDESFYGVFANAIGVYDGNRKKFANWPPYAIMDDHFRENGYTFGRSGAFPEEDLVRADSLEELAAKLGLDGDALRKTIDEYNAGVDAGVDPFGRGSLVVSHSSGDPSYPHPNLGRIEKAPFWGTRLYITTSGILTHGLAIDGDARVVTRDRRPIPGLYATGNATAHADLPFGYENGFANGRNMTYGFVAARHAMTR